MPSPQDTRADAWGRQIDAFRAMQPLDRVRLALTMADHIREIARAGVRERHPEWTPAQIQEGLEEIVLGVELSRTVRRGRSAVSP